MGTTGRKDPLLIGALQILSPPAIHGPNPFSRLASDRCPAGIVLTVAAYLDRLTLIITTVFVISICAVIAGLEARCPRGKVATHKAVAAPSSLAIGEASIFIASVAVITGLDAGLHEAIAAAGFFTVVEAIISIVVIAIIAGFETGLSLLDILPQRAIATASRTTGNAGIKGIFVAIITVLKSNGTELKVTPNDPVTASGFLAAICARVEITSVAVIAGFSLLHLPVATNAGDGSNAVVRTPIIIDLVPIVAFLHPYVENGIAAGSRLARIGASIGSKRIAIVTGLTMVDATVATALLEAGG